MSDMGSRLKKKQEEQPVYKTDVTYIDDLTSDMDYDPWEEDENGEPVIYWGGDLSEAGVTDYGGKGVRNRHQARKLAREDFANGIQGRKVRYVGNQRTSYGVQQPGSQYPAYQVKDMTPVMQKAYDKAYSTAMGQYLDQENKKKHNLELLDTIRNKGGAEAEDAIQTWTREHTDEDAEHIANVLGWLPGSQWMFIPSVLKSIGQMRSNGLTGPGWTALQVGMGVGAFLPLGELFGGAGERWGSVAGGKLGTLAKLEREGNQFIPKFNFNKSLYKAMGNTSLARSSARLMSKSNVQLATEILNSAKKELKGLTTKYNLTSVAENTLSGDAQKAIADARIKVLGAQLRLNNALRAQAITGNYFPVPRKRSLAGYQNLGNMLGYDKDYVRRAPQYNSESEKLRGLLDTKSDVERAIREAYARYQEDLNRWQKNVNDVKKNIPFLKRNGYKLSNLVGFDGRLLYKPNLMDYIVGNAILSRIPLSKFDKSAFDKALARGVDFSKRFKNFGLSFDENGKLIWNRIYEPKLTFTGGNVEIPVFGSFNPKTGEVDKVKVSVTLSNKITHGEQKNFQYPVSEIVSSFNENGSFPYPKVVDMLFAEEGSVSPELKQVVQHNVDEVRKALGGGDVIGTASVAGDVPHLIDDMDWITTDKLLHEKGISYTLNDRDKFVYSMGAEYGGFGMIDVNVIRTGSDGNAEGYIAEEIFRQFYPEEYSKAILDAWSEGSRHPKIPYTPEQLLETYHNNIKVKHVIDVLDSGKDKHAGRLFGQLMHLDPDLMSEGIDKFARSMMGNNIVKPPKFAFDNVEENIELLKVMGIPFDISKDPKRMQNAFDIWFYESLRNYRGVDNTFLGDRDKIVWILDSNPARYDYEGIWSVNRGHSHHGPIARRKQIVVPDIEQARTPQEAVRMINHSLGKYPLTEEECAIMGNPDLRPGMVGDDIKRLMQSEESQNRIYADLQKVGIQGIESDDYQDGAPLFRAGNGLPGSSQYVESFVEPMPLSQRVETITGSNSGRDKLLWSYSHIDKDLIFDLDHPYEYTARKSLSPYPSRITFHDPLAIDPLFKYGSKQQQKTLDRLDRAIDEVSGRAQKEEELRLARLNLLDAAKKQTKKLYENARFKRDLKNTIGSIAKGVGTAVSGIGILGGGVYAANEAVNAGINAHHYNWLKKEYGLDKVTIDSLLPEYNRIFHYNETDPSRLAERLYRELQRGETKTLEKLGLTNNIPTQKSGGALTSRYGFPILR